MKAIALPPQFIMEEPIAPKPPTYLKLVRSDFYRFVRYDVEKVSLEGRSHMVSTLNAYIEITPEVRGGKPRIVGRRITVADVVVMHLRMGNPLAIVSEEYDLSLSEVYGAMAYYYDHKAEIDQSMAESDAFVETMRSQGSSPLQEKLQRLKHQG